MKHAHLGDEQRIDILAEELWKEEIKATARQQRFETQVLKRERDYRDEIKLALEKARNKFQAYVEKNNTLAIHVSCIQGRLELDDDFCALLQEQNIPMVAQVYNHLAHPVNNLPNNPNAPPFFYFSPNNSICLVYLPTVPSYIGPSR